MKGMLTPKILQWFAKMSDYAPDTWSDAPITRKCLSTSKALQDTLKNAMPAIEGNHHTNSEDAAIEDIKVHFFAEGGYNYLWFISFSSKSSGQDGATSMYKAILREPNDDALLPYQIENEIAHLIFIANNHPSIPVPKVYAYDTGTTGNQPFILMEYIDGQPLSSAWSTYTEVDKLTAARQVAQIIVEMSEITFDRIGGLTLAYDIGPTVEGMKLFKGRVRSLKVARLRAYSELTARLQDKFHSPDCYDIGPYDSMHDYVLACYDKEIYYYTHAPASTIDQSLFDVVPRDQFVKSLQETRDRLASSPSSFLPEQPFALVHNDINGRNIMMRDNKIAAILDWEFAGSYPLSEILAGRGVDMLEMVDEETAEENGVWSLRMLELVAEAAIARGKGEEKVKMLVGDGNEELGLARMEMVPDVLGEYESDSMAGSDAE